MSVRRFLAALAAMSAVTTAALAEDFEAGALTIEAPWARPSIGSATSSAAYMRLENAGDTPDRLMSVTSDVAGQAMIHESRMEGDVMKMRHVEGGIEVPAHGSAELKPLGLHVMLMGLERPLRDGDTIAMTLRFEKQGEVAIKVKVGRSPASAGKDHEHH